MATFCPEMVLMNSSIVKSAVLTVLKLVNQRNISRRMFRSNALNSILVMLTNINIRVHYNIIVEETELTILLLY